MKRYTSKGDIKSDELMSSVAEIHRVAQANQQRLHLLEMAVANLTNICTALRYDLDPMKVRAESIDMGTPFSRSPSPSLGSKDEILGGQMQQLVEQATALRILKKPKSIHSRSSDAESVDGNSETTMRPTTKRMQASNNQKRRTTVIHTAVSTTEKKTSMKVATTKNDRETTQVKASAKLSMKSTVMGTKTTISDVYDDSIRKRNKELTPVSVPMKSSLRNVQVKSKGLINTAINTNQRETRQTEATIPQTLTMSSLQSEPETTIEPDLKPRRKWSAPKELTLK